MRLAPLSLALLSLVPALASAQLATVASVPSIVVSQDQVGAVTVNFTGLTASGFQFSNLTTSLGPFTGSLVSVSVNATLDASTNYTYADDLTVYVDPLPLSTGGLVQIGGFSDLSASQRYTWANGASSAPGTTVIDTVTLTTPIMFNGNASDPTIWLGNGYGDATASGTWTGSLTMVFAPVPEPSSWAMFAAGAVGLAGFMARRRREQR